MLDEEAERKRSESPPERLSAVGAMEVRGIMQRTSKMDYTASTHIPTGEGDYQDNST